MRSTLNAQATALLRSRLGKTNPLESSRERKRAAAGAIIHVVISDADHYKHCQSRLNGAELMGEIRFILRRGLTGK